MKGILIAFFSVICLATFGQISVTGTATATSAPNNGPAIVVDAALTVTAAASIPVFRVRISSNFSSGDVLAYSGSLPSGVTGSYASGTGIYTFTGSATAADYQALLRTVTFNTTSSVTLARTITFEAGDGTLSYNAANGHFYNYISTTFSWTGAKADAESKTFFGLQGYLATITNSAENTFVAALSKGWLGGSDEFSQINIAKGVTTYANQAASEGNWYWITGPEKGTRFSIGSSAVTYANWASGEPNNANGLEHYLENSNASGPWNDGQNTGSNGYILEFGGVSGDPAVDIYHTRDITMIATKLETVLASSTYKLHNTAYFVDPNMNLYSSGSITDAKVTISGNFNSGDVLSYSGSLPSGITVSGSGYNASTGVLSFSGTTTPVNWQGLFRTVKFNSTSNVIGNRSITFSVGNQVANSNGHFYESVSATANWSTAKTNAAAKTYLGLQGYLATITTSAENDFIRLKLGTDAWIGLSDSYTDINAATGASTYASQTNSEGLWYWVTGPEKGTQVTTANAPNGTSVAPVFGSTFNNWNLGEPNNSSSNENYGEIYASGTNLGKWNDLSGSGSLQYVVEYGGLSTDPLVFLSANSTIVINSVLPVTGLEFNVQQDNHSVALNWSTQTEFNCDHFDVLRSADGVTFNKIGELAGHGNTDIKQEYQYVDKSPADGMNYYRLQQFDIDGEFKYSLVRQINYSSVQTSLSPNPTTGQLMIVHNSGGSNTLLVVYNIAGKVMMQKKLSSLNTSVNVQAFPSGMYIAEIIDSKTAQHLTFIKQ